MSTHGSMGISRPGRKGRGPEWLRIPQLMLFLLMQIEEDLTVTKEPSFAYPVLTDFFPSGRPLRFEAEFEDADGNRLSCTRLREDCLHCDPKCWPKQVRQTISLPEEARKFLVKDGKEVLYSEEIPDPPKVDVECSYDAQAGTITVKWQATAPGQEDDAGLWYLVHYHSREAWRGLAPRTQDHEAVVDLKRLSLPVTVPIRVLATSGIATGIGECQQKPPSGGSTAPGGSVVIVGGDPTDKPVPLGQHLRVQAVDEGGRSIPGAEIRWYDEAGRELMRGRDLDVTTLGEGEHVVHAVAIGTAGRPLIRTIVLNRPQPYDPCHLVSSLIPPTQPDAPVHRHAEGEMHDH